MTDPRARLDLARETLTWEGPSDETVEITFPWPEGISPADFDLLTFDGAVEGGRGGFIVYLAHPGYQNGYKATYYAVDRPPTPPASVHCDLHMPEVYEDSFNAKSPAQLTIVGRPRRTGSTGEQPTRVIKIAHVRLVKQAIAADWDQVHFTITKTADGGIVYRYPVDITSKSGQPVSVVAQFAPMDFKRAKAVVTPAEFPLAPGEKRTVSVELSLPKPWPGEPPLYTEQGLFFAEVKGRPDTRTGILRSNDFLPLVVTRPLGKVPGTAVLDLAPASATPQLRDEVLNAGDLLPSPEEKLKYVKDDWMVPWWQKIHMPNAKKIAQLTGQYLKTGDDSYAQAAKKFILQYTERAPQYPRVYFGCGLPTICNSTIGHSTLEASWFMNDFLPAFDALRAKGVFTRAEYDRILTHFLLPEAVIMRNHNVGLNNMQIEVNSRIFYIGMLTENWPLVSFAYSGLCGFTDQLALNYSADGWAFEGHYYAACVDPMTQQAVLMDRFGIPVFDQHYRRLFEAAVSKAPFWHCTLPMGALAVAAEKYRQPLYAQLNDPKVLATIPSANMAAHGITVLRRNIGGELYALGMNWGCQEMRDAPDRMGVFIRSPFVSVDQATYNHNSIDQSSIVVDGQNQTPLRGRLDQFVPDGPAAIIAASNDRLYEGVTLYRTAISLETGAFIVIDRAASAKEHTYDWPATGIPRPAELSFTPGTDLLGTEHGYAGVKEKAIVDGLWGVRDAKRAILVLPWPQTLVATHVHPEGWRSPTTLVRRTGTTVDAGVAYIPTANSGDVQFTWVKRDVKKVTAELIDDGTCWTITIDYAGKPDRRCTVTRR